jgi:hypothetical protein
MSGDVYDEKVNDLPHRHSVDYYDYKVDNYESCYKLDGLALCWDMDTVDEAEEPARISIATEREPQVSIAARVPRR